MASGARAQRIRYVDRAFFPQPQAEALDVGEQACSAGRLGIGEKVGKGRARELLFGPALDRPETRGDPRLGRKGQQGLGKAVDGLDSQAARRFEHLARTSAGRALVNRGVWRSPSVNRSFARSFSGIRTQAPAARRCGSPFRPRRPW